MKKTLLGTALLFALAQALPMDAQKQVRLTFNRAGGTAVSNVTVKVTDESGNAINGVTATLQSIKQGTGTDATATATDVALKSGEQLNKHPEILCASYSNGKNAFAEFTFKISGLSDFSLNHSDLQISAMNKDGKFQNSKDERYCDVRVWGNENKRTLIASVDGILADKLGGNYEVDNTIDWEIKTTTTTQATTDQYIVVRMAKNDRNTGCFFGLKQITLYNGYRFATTATSNIDNVATFSASSPVTFSSDATAYIAINSDNKQVTLSPLNGALAAGQGAIVSKATTGDIYAYVSTEATDSRNNLLVGSGDATKELTDGNYYIFNKQGEEAVFSPLSNTASTTLAANKAALKTATPGGQALTLDFGSVTGINTATTAMPATNATFDLSGRKVSGKLPAGLYIKNGKKLLIK
ncbi:secreted protein [Prevotella sp. CAG:5226]|nr:secreted protein [Prevotella sp. CAG:5226]